MITDQDKTKEQLIAELNELRRLVNPWPLAESACGQEETRQVKELLKENEEHFRIIADYTYDWESWVDPDGKLLWVNPAVERITGYSREEYLTMPDRLKHIIFDDDQERILSHFENGIKHKKSGNDVEFRIRRKDGSLNRVSVSYHPMYTDDGECLGLRSSIRDITERKQVESALMESEARYRELVENVNSVILRFNARGRITFCNKFTERLFGYSREELIAQSASGTMVPAIDSSGRNLAALLGDVIASPELHSRNENENICKDGRRLWMAWTNTAIRDEDGNIYEFLAVGNDVTAQRQLKIALLESEEKYRTLLNDATDAILLADDQGNIFEANTQAKALLSYTAQEFAGMNFADLHPEQERDSIVNLVKTTLLPKGVWSLHDVHLQKKDGSSVSVDITGSFVEYAGKRVIQAVVRDISERKAAEAELQVYRCHLENLVTTRTDELTALNLQLQQKIEEHKKTEFALRRSEEQFRTVVETCSDAIVTVDSSGNIVLWNKGAESLYGYQAQEILGKPFLCLIAGDLQENHRQYFTHFLAERKLGIIVRHGQLRGRRKDGSEFPSEGSASLWETSDGVFVTSMIRDISERKRSEELLKQSEERFRNLAQTATEAIIIINSKGAIIFWNKSAERLYGYTEKEVLHKNNSMLVPARLQSQSERYFEQLRRDRTIAAANHLYESCARNKNGSEFPVEVALARWGTGDSSFYCVLLRDITERSKAADELRQSEERFRSLAQSALDGIVITDEDRRIIFWNKAAERIFGYSEQEVRGKISTFLVPEEQRKANESAFQQLLAADIPATIAKTSETIGRRKNGTTFPSEVSFSTWQARGKNFYCLVIRDVTERKQAEKAIKDSEDKFRSMAEHISAAVFIYQGTRLVYANNAAVKLSGYSCEELLNMRLWDIIHPDLKEQATEWDRMQQAGEKLPPRFELKIKTKKGVVRWLDYTAAIINYNGQDAVLGTAVDITERKMAEKALRQSEERHRLTAEHVPFHIGSTDQSYKYVLWNKHSEKMFGYTQEEVINKLSPSAVHASKKEGKAVVAAAIDKGIYDNELNLRRRDGSVFPAHLVVVPNKDERGNIIGMHGFAEDITQRKRDEELIKKVNDCLLSFSADPGKNIQKIVEVAGTILDGASASYHKKVDGLLHIAAAWNLPAHYLRAPRLSARHFDALCARCGDNPFTINISEKKELLPKASPMLQLGFKDFIAAPVKRQDTLIGSLNVAFRAPKTLSPNEQNIFSILTKAVSIEEERKRVLEDLKKHQQELNNSEKRLKIFSGRLLSIREEEKKNISSALHDELGSLVVALSSGLMIAREEIIENSLDPALKSIEQTEAALKHAVENLKKIIIDLRPPDLHIVGLSNALRSLCTTTAQQTKTAIDCSFDVEDNTIDEDTAITLYRTAQESLNNVHKHARAKKVTIRLSREKNKLNLSITDDGRGFDIASLDAGGKGSTKIGIQGIRERVAALNGTFSLQSAPQKGTALHITIPAKKRRRP